MQKEGIKMLKPVAIGTAATAVAVVVGYGIYKGYQHFFGNTKPAENPCCSIVETPEVVEDVELPEIQAETPVENQTSEPTVNSGDFFEL